MLELEDHVHFVPGRVREQQGVVGADAGHFADGEVPIASPVEDLAVHLLQELVDLRTHQRAAARGRCRPVDQLDLLGDEVDHIHPEAVDAAVQPPVHHRVDGLAHLRVLPVEVGLLLREQVQVVLIGARIERPGWAAEGAAPTVRRAAVSLGLAPPVPVPLWTGQRRLRLLEPGVLVAGVVHHEVHHDFQAALVGLGQQQVELRQVAEDRFDVLVVADVVTVVVLR